MAKAPRPKQGGYDAAKARQERARQVSRVALKDSDFAFTWRPHGLPVRARSEVVNQTGKVVEDLLWGHDTVDVALFADMWWISRLASGEQETIEIGGQTRTLGPLLRSTVQEEFDSRCPGAVYGDFEQTDISNEVDDSPEA